MAIRRVPNRPGCSYRLRSTETIQKVKKLLPALQHAFWYQHLVSRKGFQFELEGFLRLRPCEILAQCAVENLAKSRVVLRCFLLCGSHQLIGEIDGGSHT